MEKPRIFSNMGKTGLLRREPLVELNGQRRVLIENHMGITAYGLNEIHVRVSYGTLSVSGDSLTVLQLSPEQLVIGGKIDALQILGR